MKHPEATPWCVDTEEIINSVNYISFKNKEIINNIKHIDSQIRENTIRIQGIISKTDFLSLLSKIREFKGTLKVRNTEEFILEINIDKN